MNKSKTISLFTVQIKICESFLNESEINSLLLNIKKNKHGNHTALEGKAVSSHNINTNILNEENIKNKLHNIINEYSNVLGVDEQTLDNSWTNIQSKNSILKKHSHGLSPISGAIYLKVDELSSNIYFYNPNPYIHNMSIKSYNTNNYHYVFFKPKIGDLFIFPGWLHHGSDYEKNNSEERIVLSFNTKNK
jgi:uncharacterized protein (TIGR02466 family)